MNEFLKAAAVLFLVNAIAAIPAGLFLAWFKHRRKGKAPK